MMPPCDKSIRWYLIPIIMLLMLTACSISIPTATPSWGTPTAFMETSVDRSPEAIATLNSLEKLSSYPFYVMHYVGGYDYPQLGRTTTETSSFSCSLFTALGEPGEMSYGRNFDWEYSPALLVFTNPPDGFASASMVDLTFIGIDPSDADNLLELDLDEQNALLSAPSMPFDGMNENGLTVGMAALPDEFSDDAGYDPTKTTIGSIGIIRQVLDHARNVNEAVDIFRRYNIDFSGGPPIHYLLADPSGKAALIEFYQGEMMVLDNQYPWHLATNHLRYDTKGDGNCWRYHTLAERLSELEGQLDERSAMQLLSEVRQGMTQWSSIYNMSTGNINIAIAGDYQTIFSFHLGLSKP